MKARWSRLASFLLDCGFLIAALALLIPLLYRFVVVFVETLRDTECFP